LVVTCEKGMAQFMDCCSAGARSGFWIRYVARDQSACMVRDNQRRACLWVVIHPFAGIGIATYIIGYLIMRYEWRDRTSLRLLSYPMSGAGIISAKLLVAVLALGLIAVVAAAGTWLVTQRSLIPPPAIASLTEDILQLKPWERALDIIWLVACLILAAAFITAVGIFSFVTGTIVPRASGLIAVIVYGLVGYLTSGFRALCNVCVLVRAQPGTDSV